MHFITGSVIRSNYNKNKTSYNSQQKTNKLYKNSIYIYAIKKNNADNNLLIENDTRYDLSKWYIPNPRDQTPLYERPVQYIKDDKCEDSEGNTISAQYVFDKKNNKWIQRV